MAAALCVALTCAGVAAAAKTRFNGSDFKLATVSSSLGAPDQSGIEFDGTISRRAYNAGLRPNLHFILSASVTCAPASDPTQTSTSTVSIDSQTGGFIVTQPFSFHKLGGGVVGWSYIVTFPAVPFDDFDAFRWCPASTSTSVLEGFSLSGASGIAWVAPIGNAPQAGTTVYGYSVGAGSSLVKPIPTAS
jgi:hypothetical protein